MARLFSYSLSNGIDPEFLETVASESLRYNLPRVLIIYPANTGALDTLHKYFQVLLDAKAPPEKVGFKYNEDNTAYIRWFGQTFELESSLAIIKNCVILMLDVKN